MKRDMDLVRSILLELEDKEEPGEWLKPEDITGYNSELVGYHIHLLDQAGLIEVLDSRSQAHPMSWTALRLTWEGHEFLEASRDSSMWEKAKDMILSSGGSMTFDVLKTVLIKLATDAVIK